MYQTEIILFCICLVLSAVFSATETAFTSLSPAQAQKLGSKGPRGKRVQKLTERLDKLITTLLIGNNIVNIGASAIATELTIRVFSNTYLGISTGLLTLVILIFCEVTPKRLAILFNEPICLVSADFIRILIFLFTPVSFVLSLTANGISRVFGGRKIERVTLENVLHMISAAENMGVVKQEEQQFVRNIFHFKNVTAHSVMTHRIEVFSLEIAKPVSSVLPQVMEHGFSRIPVYDRNPESVEGIVLYKDIMAAVHAGKPETKLRELMIPAPYVSATKPAQEVFNRMRAMHVNMAIVLDEYGGLAGIVAMEDIIEQLFGELYDEDEEHGGDEKISKMEDGSYMIEASTSLFYLSDMLDLEFETNRKVQTLSKYLISLCRDIPRKGDEFIIPRGKFIIETVARRKIKIVKFIPIDPESKDN